jgi:hypothetical protein
MRAGGCAHLHYALTDPVPAAPAVGLAIELLAAELLAAAAEAVRAAALARQARPVATSATEGQGRARQRGQRRRQQTQSTVIHGWGTVDGGVGWVGKRGGVQVTGLRAHAHTHIHTQYHL